VWQQLTGADRPQAGPAWLVAAASSASAARTHDPQPAALTPGEDAVADIRRLTWSISRASDWHELGALYARNGARLDRIHLATLFVRMAHLAGPGASGGAAAAAAAPAERNPGWQPRGVQQPQQRPTLQLVLLAGQAQEQACLEAAQLSGRQVSNMLWALSKLTQAWAPAWQPSPACLCALQRRAVALLEQQVTYCPAPLRAGSGGGGGGGGGAAASAPKSQQRHESQAFNPQELANAAYAWSYLPCTSQPLLLAALCSAAAAQFQQFGAQDLSNMLFALARLRYRPSAAWLAGWSARAASQLAWFTSQGLANSAWALARLGHYEPRLMEALMQRAAAKQLQPQELCNLLWAAGVLGHQADRKLLRDLLLPAARQLPSYAAADVAVLLHSLALLGFLPDAAWVEAFFAATQQHLAAAQPVDVTQLLWACARLQLLPPPAWRAAAMQRSLHLLPACQPSELAVQVRPTAPAARRMLSRHISRTPCARHRKLAAAAWDSRGVVMPPRPPTSPPPLCPAAPQLPPPQLISQITANAMSRLARPVHVPQVYAYARMGWLPPQPWWASFLAAAQSALPGFGAQDISNTLWALARLGVACPPRCERGCWLALMPAAAGPCERAAQARWLLAVKSLPRPSTPPTRLLPSSPSSPAELQLAG
jgi:hypothetical protein